jgi:hypothetical protein
VSLREGLERTIAYFRPLVEVAVAPSDAFAGRVSAMPTAAAVVVR